MELAEIYSKIGPNATRDSRRLFECTFRVPQDSILKSIEIPQPERGTHEARIRQEQMIFVAEGKSVVDFNSFLVESMVFRWWFRKT